MTRFLTAGALAVVLAGCTPEQMAGLQSKVSITAERLSPPIADACGSLNNLMRYVGLIPGASYLPAYVNSACNTVEGAAKLAADPSSLAWLGQLTGQLRTLAGLAGIKLPG